jgi:hypothetical protein
MNGTFVFVLLIIAMVMSTAVIRTYIKQRGIRPPHDEDLEETLARIDLLEERIRVLERIITEHRIDLKQEIDNL